MWFIHARLANLTLMTNLNLHFASYSRVPSGKHKDQEIATFWSYGRILPSAADRSRSGSLPHYSLEKDRPIIDRMLSVAWKGRPKKQHQYLDANESWKITVRNGQQKWMEEVYIAANSEIDDGRQDTTRPSISTHVLLSPSTFLFCAHRFFIYSNDNVFVIPRHRFIFHCML